MSTIYINGEPLELEAGTLGDWLFKQFPKGNVVALDTEASGLYVDGDWTDGPPARVSAVSLAWRMRGGRLVTVAMPFDQGKIGGKPGKWSDELDDYEPIDHAAHCVYDGMDDGPDIRCICAPWNLSETDWNALLDWLTGRTGDYEPKRVMMHFGKYDVHIMLAGHRLYKAGIDLTGLWTWDTGLAQGIITPLESSALKPTSERLWGEDTRDAERAVKDALKKNGVGLTWRYDLLPWEILGLYAGKDAELTLRLAEHQESLIAEGAVPELDFTIIKNELELSKLLFKMELRGVGFDAEGMRVEASKMEQEIKRIEKDLPFQPASITAAKRYFFEELGVVPVKTSDVCSLCTFNRVKGKQAKNSKKTLCLGTHKWTPSLDSEVVSRLAADKVLGADQWLHLANMNSALSKWYRAWPEKVGEDGRLRTNFRQGRIESDRKGMTSGGAISGRLSAERIQLQGVPQEWRIPEFIRGIKPKKDGTPGLILAKPYYQVWEIDASNAEVRVGAWLSQCHALAERINSGVNIHDENTRTIFGIDEDSPEWTMFRVSAKRGIFGRMYGAGIRTLKAQIDNDLKRSIPEVKIRAFMDALDAEYPELKRTARRCQAKADKSLGGCGYVRLVNGRKRVFGWAERTHKAFNACIQGGVAETMKTFMLMVEQAYPGALINQVHDSIWVEVPDLFADFIVQDIQAMGAKLFTETFSTEDLTINFEFDAKRLA